MYTRLWSVEGEFWSSEVIAAAPWFSYAFTASVRTLRTVSGMKVVSRSLRRGNEVNSFTLRTTATISTVVIQKQKKMRRNNFMIAALHHVWLFDAHRYSPYYGLSGDALGHRV